MDSSIGDGSDAPMIGGDMPPMDDDSMDGMGEDLGNDQMDGMGDQASDAGLPPMDDGDSDGINDDGADGNSDDNSNPEDNELMDIINSLSIEDKAAVEKYAKSMVDDDKSSASDDMPMESRVSRFKNLVDETINSFLYDDDEDDRVERMPKEYKNLSNPFKSPYE